jgi:hypothetical protein
MVKMTKAQAKRRLLEAQAKFQKVYTSASTSWPAAVQTADMAAVEKIVSRCLKRLG